MNLASFLPAWLRKSDGGTVTDPAGVLRALADAGRSKSGAVVTWQTAIRVVTFFACARVIAEGLAQVPLKLYRESPDGRSREPAREHPLYDVLYRRPNEWQTSYEYRETIGLHLVVAGNHYSYKNVVRGQVAELIPLDPATVTVKRRDDLELEYQVRNRTGSAAARTFRADEIWHLRGPSWNGWQGLDTVRDIARETLGLSISTESAAAELSANGLAPSGTYSVEGTLNDVQYKALRVFLAENYGAGRRGLPMILDRAAKWQQQSMSGVDAQHLETRQLQAAEVCRALRVMPIMVGISDKAATYASAEQMFLAHVVHTLAPWYQRLEQSIDAWLLTEKDRAAGLYANFVEEGLLRGSLRDTKDTVLGYVNGGILTPNEGRAKLDMNPDTDPASDRLRIPANIVGETPAEPEPKPQGA